MKWKTIVTVSILLGVSATVQASDPIGIYAILDRVQLEPNDASPKSIRLWGVFALAEGKAGERYGTPLHGTMHFDLVPDKAPIILKEWADLKKLAGTGQCVAFGSRYKPKGTVRKLSEKPSPPDPYQVGFGLVKVGTNHPQAKILRTVPLPITPGEIEPGVATLRARSREGKEAKGTFVFEIHATNGEREASGPVALKNAQASWSPKMKIEAGAKYTWYVWSVSDGKKGPAVNMSLTGKAKP